MSSAILIVDDEAVWARNLVRYLGRHGFAAQSAGSIRDAEALLDESRPALLCLDLRLPDGHGLELLKRRRASGDATPCILITGYASPETEAEAATLGAILLRKPTPLAEIHARITGLLAKPRSSAPAEPRRRIVLMYSHDGYGLGHMRRNLNIASQLRRQVSGLDVLMLVGCPNGMFFDVPAGIDVLKLPSVVKVDTGRWESGKLGLGVETTTALRAGLILHTAQSLRPDLVLVDFLPQGVGGELLPMLDWLADSGQQTRTVLGLREILDLPERVRGAWAAQRTVATIDRHYDRVLVYGEREVFDTGAAYGLVPTLADRLSYCGYVAPPPLEQDPLRSEDGRPHVVVSVGGGRDGYTLLATALRALRLIPASRRPRATLVTGPLMEPGDRSRLDELAHDLPVDLRAWARDGRALAATADVVVSMAGYNSLTELIGIGKRPIVVPRAGPSHEQLLRTALFERLGLVRPILPDLLGPERLAAAILAALDEPALPRRRPAIALDGAARAAHAIAGLLADAPVRPLDRDLALAGAR